MPFRSPSANALRAWWGFETGHPELFNLISKKFAIKKKCNNE